MIETNFEKNVLIGGIILLFLIALYYIFQIPHPEPIYTDEYRLLLLTKKVLIR